MLTYSINRHVVGKTKEGHVKSAAGWKQSSSTLEDLLQLTASDGLGFMPGLLTHSAKVKTDLQKFCTVVIDIDNSDGDGQTTWDEAKDNPFLQKNALCMWTSSNHMVDDGDPDSHYNGQDRYRIMFKLEEDFTLCPAGNTKNYKEFHEIIKRLNAMVPGADPNITPIHYFAGTHDGLQHTFNESNVLNLDEVPNLETPPESQRLFDAVEFRGDGKDSIQNVHRFLHHIDSSSMETWLSVAGCLKNIGEAIGDDVALDLFLEWCPKDYPYFDEAKSINLWERLEPKGGGFGKLKSIAEDSGMQSSNSSLAPFDVSEFGITDGYKAPTDDVSVITPYISTDANGIVTLLDNTGKYRDLTYAKDKVIKLKDLLHTLEVVTAGSTLRYNTAKQTIERDGIEIPQDEMNTLHIELSQQYDINFPRETNKAMISLALRNPFDPYREELERIEREVTPIPIHNIASRYFKTNTALADTMMQKWLGGLVTKLMKPGTSIRSCLVVVGKQNIGKDAFVNIICGADNKVVPVGHDTRLNDNNFKLSLSEAWVANLNEVEQVTRKQVTGHLKAWLTETSDKIPVKFQMCSRDFPRRFSYYGSCNEAKFLQDPTGNTRWWVIESPLDYSCKGERVDLALLKSERESILAGAMQLYRLWQKGELNFELTHEQLSQSEINNSDYVEEAAYFEQLQSLLHGRTTTCWTELCELVEFTSGMKGQRNLTNQLKQSYQQLGFEVTSPRKVDGKSMKLIVRTGDKPNLDELKFHLAKLNGVTDF